jgi:hypothetical protein
MNISNKLRNLLALIATCGLLAPLARAEEHHQHAAASATDSATSAVETTESEEEIAIRESISKLPTKDQKLAVAQGYCPVMAENRLGTMGAPIKIMIEDQPVFLCCAGCKRRAMADPTKTLATVGELKAKVEAATIERNLADLSEEDRNLVLAQGYCPVMPESRLGVMGIPIKVTIADQTFFVCCEGCSKDAAANPEQTLKVVAELQAKVVAEAEAAAENTAAGDGN